METLKEIREKRGVKQIAVADYLGITRQTYAQYEENPRVMTVGLNSVRLRERNSGQQNT